MAQDVAFYAMGLFPLYQYASTGVKPAILDIFDNYFLPLNHKLLPCLPGILLGLVPGLEDENGDHYTRVMRMINKIIDVTGNTLVKTHF